MKKKPTPEQWQKLTQIVVDLWQEFNESAEGREMVLEIFDSAEKDFQHKPHIARLFATLKKGFLASEVKNA